MIDLLLEPAKVFIAGGIEQFRKSQELKNLTVAVKDRLRREIQFNTAILDEAIKLRGKGRDGEDEEGTPGNDDVIVALILSLRTQAFDAVNEGPIPVCLMISGPLDKSRWPSMRAKEKYDGYLASTTTVEELLDRTYYRIHIVKTLASCGKLGFNLGYIRYMLICLRMAL